MQHSQENNHECALNIMVTLKCIHVATLLGEL